MASGSAKAGSAKLSRKKPKKIPSTKKQIEGYIENRERELGRRATAAERDKYAADWKNMGRKLSKRKRRQDDFLQKKAFVKAVKSLPENKVSHRGRDVPMRWGENIWLLKEWVQAEITRRLSIANDIARSCPANGGKILTSHNLRTADQLIQSVCQKPEI